MRGVSELMAAWSPDWFTGLASSQAVGCPASSAALQFYNNRPILLLA
jgi:hypothetical protein